MDAKPRELYLLFRAYEVSLRQSVREKEKHTAAELYPFIRGLDRGGWGEGRGSGGFDSAEYAVIPRGGRCAALIFAGNLLKR